VATSIEQVREAEADDAGNSDRVDPQWTQQRRFRTL